MVHKRLLGFAAVDAGLSAYLEVEGQTIDLRSVPPTFLPDSVIQLTRHVNPDSELRIACYLSTMHVFMLIIENCSGHFNQKTN